VAPPFKVAEFDIMYNEGISKVGDVLDIGVAQDIIAKRGSFYSYGETRLAQGRENAKQFLIENPEMTLEIENLIREKFNLPQKDSVVPDGDGSSET
jgi:recombination protein RecA